MSKIIVLSVVVAAAVFASVAVTVQKRTSEVSDVISADLNEIQGRACGNLAMSYAIKQVQDGFIPFTQEGYLETFPNFNVLSGSIDSIRYTTNAAQDTIQIISYVNTSYMGQDIFHKSQAGIGLQGGSLPGIVAHWLMDDDYWSGTNNDVIDGTNFHHHGIAYSGAHTVEDSPGYPFDKVGKFDGYNDYVEMPVGVCDKYNDEMTVTVGVKIERLPLFDIDWGILATEYRTTDWGFVPVWSMRAFTFRFLWWYYVRCYLFVFTDNGIKYTGIQKCGSQGQIYKWHSVAAIYDGSTSNPTITVNVAHTGLKGTTTIGEGNQWTGRNPDNIISVGGRDGIIPPLACFDGKLAGVGIWDRALTDLEIDDLFDEYAQGNTPVNADGITINIVYWSE